MLNSDLNSSHDIPKFPWEVPAPPWFRTNDMASSRNCLIVNLCEYFEKYLLRCCVHSGIYWCHRHIWLLHVYNLDKTKQISHDIWCDIRIFKYVPNLSSSNLISYYLSTWINMLITFVLQGIQSSAKLKLTLSLRLGLKLIMSLSIHMMTSQSRMCVQCVRNGLQGNIVWKNTEKDTLEESCIHVLGVGNVFYRSAAWVATRIFTQVDASAQNVTNVVIAVVS